MPFPFIPGGAVLALAVLGGALVIFGAALKAMSWTIDAARGSMLGGMVSGIRDWELSSRRSARRRPASSLAPSGPTPELIDVHEDSPILLEHITPIDRVHRD